MADRELAYWTQREKDDPSGVPWITDSVLPIVEAKRAQIVKSDFALDDSVQFIPTPGHTIDHYSVLVGRRGEDALITGDMRERISRSRTISADLVTIPTGCPQRSSTSRMRRITWCSRSMG